MTPEEYWQQVDKLPQREVTHTTQRGRIVTTVVINWAEVIAPGTQVPDQYDWVLGWNPIDQRWEKPIPPKVA